MGIQFWLRDASTVLCQTWKTKQAERSAIDEASGNESLGSRHKAKSPGAHASTAIRHSAEFTLRLSPCRFHERHCRSNSRQQNALEGGPFTINRQRFADREGSNCRANNNQ
jgi:hypothetical protein